MPEPMTDLVAMPDYGSVTLSRKEGQGLIFCLPGGRSIYLTVVDRRQGKTTLRIDAPKDVEIVREELQTAR